MSVARRRFLLTAASGGDPAVAARIVGVLAVGAGEAGLQHAVAWLNDEAAAGWRRHLADAGPGTIAAVMVGWTDDSGRLGVVEISAGPPTVDLPTAAAAALHHVLAGVALHHHTNR